MTFLTRFVDAASKLTSEGGVGDVLGLEGRDNVGSGPAVEDENQVGNLNKELAIHVTIAKLLKPLPPLVNKCYLLSIHKFGVYSFQPLHRGRHIWMAKLRN